jgi:nucleotide-binding universal stress UspA family protein
MFTPKTILVPTDFSEFSDRAVRQAADIAEQNNAKVFLLHVVDKLQQCAIDYCIPLETMMKVQSDSEKEASKKMQEEVDKIVKVKKIDVVFDVKSGIPYEEILKDQQERKADLIVSRPRRTGLLKSFIGSVAERVMREAKCPVLPSGGEDPAVRSVLAVPRRAACRAPKRESFHGPEIHGEIERTCRSRRFHVAAQSSCPSRLADFLPCVLPSSRSTRQQRGWQSLL